jgi:acetylornithine deacetylase/succinyl-diaminopimelate desuccinylase-like protein
LEKIRRYETAFKVVPAVQAYFSALADSEDAETAQHYRALEQALQDEEFRQKFTATPGHNALVRNTISLTVLNGSPKTNVVPASASAHLDCRLLPGEDPHHFIAELKRLVDDPHIQFSTLLNFPSVASAPDTPLFEAIRSVAARTDPQAPVLPSVLGGFTDTHYFREKGITSYGFSGLALAAEDARGVHGLNERIPLAALRDAVQMLFEVILSIDAIPEGGNVYGG